MRRAETLFHLVQTGLLVSGIESQCRAIGVQEHRRVLLRFLALVAITPEFRIPRDVGNAALQLVAGFISCIDTKTAIPPDVQTPMPDYFPEWFRAWAKTGFSVEC